jgi:hypothetical protein
MRCLYMFVSLILVTALIAALPGCRLIGGDDGSYISMVESDAKSNEGSVDESGDGDLNDNIKFTPFFISWPCYKTVEEITSAVTDIFEGKVIRVFFDIVDIRTGKPTSNSGEKSSLWLYTVYEVEVEKQYKGECKEKVYIGVIGGKQGYMEAEQWKILKNTGIFNERIGIPVMKDNVSLETGDRYLFLVNNTPGTYHGVVDINHFALPVDDQSNGEICYASVVEHISKSDKANEY